MEIEERARGMGWVPKEEFRGDESRWVDAEMFVKRGDEVMPILKERLGKMESTMSEVKGQNARLEQIQKNLLNMQKTTSERAYKRAKRELQKEQREAVAAGDIATYDRIENEINDIEKDSEFVEEPNGIVPDTQSMNPDYPAWVAENRWYINDKKLEDYADFIGNKLIQQGLKGRALLDAVTDGVKETFPSSFENQKRTLPPTVETGGMGGGEEPRGKGKSYRDLPPDAKDACDSFVADGLMKKEEYVAEYFALEE